MTLKLADFHDTTTGACLYGYLRIREQRSERVGAAGLEPARKNAASACLKASGLVDATLSSDAIHFSDGFGMDARLVNGRYPQVHMHGAHGTMLCLYDRRTRKAEVQDAAAAIESSPLQQCYGRSANRLEVGPCLERRLAEANAEMAAEVDAASPKMQGLDAVTGRTEASSAFDRSQKAFNAYRADNCSWRAAQLGSGTGSGDAARDCMIRMALERAAELRASIR